MNRGGGELVASGALTAREDGRVGRRRVGGRNMDGKGSWEREVD